MARWKARVEFLLSVTEILFLSLAVEALQGKMCQNSLPLGGGRSLAAKISGRRGRPWGIFFGFYKIRHFAIRHCKLHRATYRRFDTIPACGGRTDGQTHGIAVASTAFAMRALRRAVRRKNSLKAQRRNWHATHWALVGSIYAYLYWPFYRPCYT